MEFYGIVCRGYFNLKFLSGKIPFNRTGFFFSEIIHSLPKTEKVIIWNSFIFTRGNVQAHDVHAWGYSSQQRLPR